ncbi:MAG: response regulator [Melioribacteraceae bacterium]|nr:response regulator [Melioribacteraceae bacterium]
MNTIKTIIIDDEKLAREDLKALLKDFPDIEILGEADNVGKGIKLIEEEEFDLIFLDIQMPGETGFDLLNKIKTDKKIIFVTAYEQFAIKAFEVSAQDYLLKPVNKERLAIAVNKIRNSENNTIDKKYKPLEYSDTIFLLMNNSYQFINISSIIKINSAAIIRKSILKERGED